MLIYSFGKGKLRLLWFEKGGSMQENDERYWIVLKLANFSLIVDRQRLLMTTTKGEDLKKVWQHFAEIDPEKSYRVENFAVKVLRRNRDGVAIEWEKITGFSLWEVLPPKEPEEE